MAAGARQGAFGSLPGRTYWQRRLDEECARAERYLRPFAVLLITIEAGDADYAGPAPVSEAVMALVAESLKRELRGSDVVCRLTPSRLGVLLVETNAAGAQAAERRLLNAIQKDMQRCLPSSMMPAVAVGRSV